MNLKMTAATLAATPVFIGPTGRTRIGNQCSLVNTLFNAHSGCIEVNDFTIFGHDVLVLTGKHDFENEWQAYLPYAPRHGRDIYIGRYAWICSRVVICGPSTIGNGAVIAANSVVIPGTEIPEGELWAGSPAKFIKKIERKKKPHPHTEAPEYLLELTRQHVENHRWFFADWYLTEYLKHYQSEEADCLQSIIEGNGRDVKPVES
jgi:acetyltransferase-like isoleucine patch superfamily enzyme